MIWKHLQGSEQNTKKSPENASLPTKRLLLRERNQSLGRRSEKYYLGDRFALNSETRSWLFAREGVGLAVGRDEGESQIPPLGRKCRWTAGERRINDNVVDAFGQTRPWRGLPPLLKFTPQFPLCCLQRESGRAHRKRHGCGHAGPGCVMDDQRLGSDVNSNTIHDGQ